ncbi:hypothetical protein [Mycolicibacterium hodleri]|uniref:hypothetical protein n=1 Tax=Mycolicibacterium hodleri TaxID=49897 RepID=UPI001F1C2F06|nr:hypothetical protein [Mycolicibacterium hodleri]
MFGEDLQTGPNDEGHEQQVKEMQYAKPSGESGVDGRLKRADAGVGLDEVLHRRDSSKMLRHSNSYDEGGGSDGQEPQDADPPLTNPDFGYPGRHRRYEVRPIADINAVIRGGELST